MLVGILIIKLFRVTMILCLIFRMGVHKGMDITVFKHMIKYSMYMDAISKKYAQHAGYYQ
jgi:hypothetical protein